MECCLKGEIPKEYSIALDVFEKSRDFNPAEDTTVRYYMHRLRQKLKSYYNEEGKRDEIKLIIPKGHYEVHFVENHLIEESIEHHETTKKYRIGIISLGIAFVISMFFVLRFLILLQDYRYVEDVIPKDDPIWSSFFKNNLETTIIIGDHFLYTEYDQILNRTRYIIDHQIQLEDSFDTFARHFPKRKLQKLVQGSLPLNSVFNLLDLFHVYQSFSKKPKLELSSVFLSSQFELVKIKDRNLIYIGGFRNLREFESIFNKLPLSYSYSAGEYFKGSISVSTQDSIKVFSTKSLEKDHYIDLGLIACIPGTKNENYMILTGFAYPAQTEIVRMISHNEGLNKIYRELGLSGQSFPNHFFMIIEFFGSEYTVMNSKIVYFKKISG